MNLCPVGHTNCYITEDNTTSGCCEADAGVCCKDKIHCCPENFACSDSHRGCIQVERKFSNATKRREIYSPNYVVCPDGVTKCPDLNTCCLLPPGGYGCCSYTEARCCSDKIHCCPNGFDCAEGTGKCKHGNTFFLPRLMTTRKMNQCEDNKTVCVNSSYCCKQPNSSYACCPSGYPVCCGSYCCPPEVPECCGGKFCCKKDSCDKEKRKCIEDKEVPYTNMKHYNKIKAIHLVRLKYSNPIKEERSDCDSLLKSCDQGCCPDKEGTCCLNQNHCCPQYYSCTSQGICIMEKY